MGSDRMRVFVKRCVDRALTLGYRTQATYGRYLDLSLIFGENFDQREAWALAVGASGPDEAPLTRIDRLHQAGLARLEQLAGEREQELC